MKGKLWTVLAVVVILSLGLVACAAPTPQVVEKQVVVEKPVVSTVVVEKEKVVEKPVVATVVVQKEVVVEKEVVVCYTGASDSHPPDTTESAVYRRHPVANRRLR